jgi:putative transposase
MPVVVPRIARAVAPGFPHHITQRGNRRQQAFFSDEDYQAYLDLITEWCTVYAINILGYCLMPNHVHLILVPENEESLALAIGKVHLRYSRRINFREGWRGHLFQGRFASYVMDEHYLLSCARYIERNPVRAKLASHPAEWRWSSARAHIDGLADGIVDVDPLLELADTDWRAFLEREDSSREVAALHRHERTGRPLGHPEFVDGVENQLGRCLRRNKPGPKPMAPR